MGFFLTIIISLQLITSSVAAELGENKAFSSKKHLLSTIAATEARYFEGALREELEKKPKSYFKEISKGSWEYLADGNKISFSSSDMYLGQLQINGKILKFRGLPQKELEEKAEKLLISKTSFIKTIYYNTFGIQEAEACELICAAVVVVVAAAVIGTAVYQLMIKPEKMVKRLNEMKDKLERDANSCVESRNDQSKYMETYFLASSISDRSALASMTSSSEALEYSIKKQLESGNRKNEDCFQIMHEIGKKVDLDIPIPSERQIQMRELGGGELQNEKIDIKTASFNLCQSYNKLGSCMENFVALHVNDSDINSFKESAEPSHWRYQKKMQGSRQ